MRHFRLPPPAVWAALALTALCACCLTGCSTAMQGSMALAQGDYDLALQRYNEALARDPDSLPLRRRIAPNSP